MSTFFKILLIADAVLAGVALILLIVKLGKSFYRKNEKKSARKEVKYLSKPALPVKEEAIPLAGKTEEPSAEESKETAEELAASEITIGDVDDDETDKQFSFGDLPIKRRPFSEKLLSLPLEIREYFDKIDNEMRSYKRISARISEPCVSYRAGRKLVAKLTVHGRTLTFYLALGIDDFKKTVFFQKDSSEIKAYAEVPFTVKVRSDRGLKNALKLAEALASKEGLEKNPRYEKINSIKLLKEKLGSKE